MGFLDIPLYQFSVQQKWDFWALGDVNQDGIIDLNDLNTITQNIGTTNPLCDLNNDNTVNDADWQIAYNNQGLNIWDYFGVPHPIPGWLVFSGLVAFGVAIGFYIWRKKRK